MITMVDMKKCIFCGGCEGLSAIKGPPIFTQSRTSPIIEVNQEEAVKRPRMTNLCINFCPTEAIYQEVGK